MTKAELIGDKAHATEQANSGKSSAGKSSHVSHEGPECDYGFKLIIIGDAGAGPRPGEICLRRRMA